MYPFEDLLLEAAIFTSNFTSPHLLLFELLFQIVYVYPQTLKDLWNPLFSRLCYQSIFFIVYLFSIRCFYFLSRFFEELN